MTAFLLYLLAIPAGIIAVVLSAIFLFLENLTIIIKALFWTLSMSMNRIRNLVLDLSKIITTMYLIYLIFAVIETYKRDGTKVGADAIIVAGGFLLRLIVVLFVVGFFIKLLCNLYELINLVIYSFFESVIVLFSSGFYFCKRKYEKLYNFIERRIPDKKILLILIVWPIKLIHLFVLISEFFLVKMGKLVDVVFILMVILGAFGAGAEKPILALGKLFKKGEWLPYVNEYLNSFVKFLIDEKEELLQTQGGLSLLIATIIVFFFTFVVSILPVILISELAIDARDDIKETVEKFEMQN